MKLFTILLLTLPLLSYSYPAADSASPLSAVSLADDKSLSLDEDVDSEHAETGKESQIQKRSGSFDYVTHLKSGLLSSIGQASASIASGSSGGSSGGGGSYKSHDSGHHGNSVSYDPWSFKKSVLNTIFQAVKAITGGVTALKGQLIKGSGYIVSSSGNLVAATGDKVTDLGKNIINSAHQHSPTYGPGPSGGGASVHPFAKFSSFSGASSGGGHKHSPGPVVHHETITSYEIPAGPSSYGPPSKPPTYSSATHQYLPPPPSGAGYSGGGAPFSGGHVAFEAPSSNYLPSSYGHDGHDDFNIYGRHKKLTDEEARKAAAQLQEILNMLPTGKKEYTATKTVTFDATNLSPSGNGGGSSSSSYDINPENVELHTYGLPNDLGNLESLSHTESITAAYAPKPSAAQYGEGPSDIYWQMAKKQTPEEIYIQKHPNEGYDYTKPTGVYGSQADESYKYSNYHANGGGNNALKELTPIIAALEVAKRGQAPISTQYTIEKNVQRIPPNGVKLGSYGLQPPVIQKSKYTYFDPNQIKYDTSYRPYGNSYKVRRQAPVYVPRTLKHDYEIQDPMAFNSLLTMT